MFSLFKNILSGGKKIEAETQAERDALAAKLAFMTVQWLERLEWPAAWERDGEKKAIMAQALRDVLSKANSKTTELQLGGIILTSLREQIGRHGDFTAIEPSEWNFKTDFIAGAELELYRRASKPTP